MLKKRHERLNDETIYKMLTKTTTSILLKQARCGF